MLKGFLFLAVSIVSEVFGSTMLKSTHGFTRIWPSLGVILGYGIAFYSLSYALKAMPLSTAYAIWSGVGTALTAMIGVLVYKEVLSWQAVVGLILIIAGVVFLNLKGPAH
ncbi:DMT family transporter [Paenibacillus sp. CN-4]|uniref:DMT family transporter n=1 Tax=Paenibacillus nanchangensis TaxID=3348343 RepID=UPI0039792389